MTESIRPRPSSKRLLAKYGRVYSEQLIDLEKEIPKIRAWQEANK